MATYQTIANLKNVANPTAYVVVEVLGYYTPNDGGGGEFYWDPNSTLTANDGTVLLNNNNPNGRILRLFSGSINVRWFGAKGDNTTNDTTSIQTALNNYQNIYFPAGTYLCNLSVINQNLHGENQINTFLKSFSASDYAITLNSQTGGWEFNSISNLQISGTGQQGGVQFGQYKAGRYVFNNVIFNNCKIAVYKPLGNIGNVFNFCEFINGEYHYFAKWKPEPNPMHTGCDTFNSCEFHGATKSCIYIDNGSNGPGLHVFNECIFELNSGFVSFIEQYGPAFVAVPIAYNSCWFESNATGTNINIEGTVYASPKTHHFNKIKEVIFRNSAVDSISVTVDTIVTLRDCVIDTSSLSVDNSSAIYADGGIIKQGSNIAILHDTPPKQCLQGANISAPWLRMNPRSTLSERLSDNILATNAFNNANVYPFPGTSVTVNAPRVKDGTSSNSCAELTIAYNNAQINSLFTPTSSKYLLWIIDIKRIAGPIPKVAIKETSTYAPESLLNISVGEWTTICGFGKVPATTPSRAAFYIKNDDVSQQNITVRIGGICFLQFDSENDAVEALASMQFFIKNIEPVIIFGTTFPNSGSWNIGDRCLNITPGVGSPKSWICTSAGTPGTWVSEGNL